MDVVWPRCFRGTWKKSGCLPSRHHTAVGCSWLLLLYRHLRGQKSLWEVSLATEVSSITSSPLVILTPRHPWDNQSPLHLVLCRDKLQLHGPLGPWHRDGRTVASGLAVWSTPGFNSQELLNLEL